MLDPDRLLPGDPSTRSVAREIYASVVDLPILSPHGHVSPSLLDENKAFSDPAALLLSADHYVTRLLHAGGADLSELGVGVELSDPRGAWRSFVERWHLFAGTATGYWVGTTLERLFGIDLASDVDADTTFSDIARALQTADFRPRALWSRFGIEVLATTDDPLDTLDAHSRLADDRSFSGRVLPTFRPDPYLDPQSPQFVERVVALTDNAGVAVDDYQGYLRALEERRAYFVAHGAVSADHGVPDAFTADLDDDTAARLYRSAVRGELDEGEARVFRGHMLVESARMSVADGLVMTIHPGISRDHSTATHHAHGPDSGHDIPVRTEYTQALRPLLERFGLEPRLHIVLFTVDESTFSRELAPLAGFYPSLYLGAPWWFLDAPDSMRRYREAVTETAGFYRTAGFVDDTRAFLSIPARHDMARRVDAGFLARLVREGRLTLPQALRIATDLVATLPREVFRL